MSRERNYHIQPLPRVVEESDLPIGRALSHLAARVIDWALDRMGEPATPGPDDQLPSA